MTDTDQTTEQPTHIHADANMRVDHGGLTRDQLVRAHAINAALGLNSRSLSTYPDVDELLTAADQITAWITDGTRPERAVAEHETTRSTR